jgi:hypothetical protein
MATAPATIGFRTTPRDVEILSFMAEQYGIRKDQLARLLGGVSERTARALIDRWVRAGLVRRRTIFLRDHAWLWPTREGLDLAPLPLPYWEPRPGMLEHVFHVNEVRMRVAERHPDATWISERRLRAEAGGANRPEHMPDAVVLKGEHHIAIEVQLAHKSRDRALAMLRHLTETYDGAWIFVRDGGPRLAIERALLQLGSFKQERVRLLPLEER